MKKILGSIPPSLGAVTLVTILVNVFKLPANTLSDIAGAATFKGGFSVLPKITLLQNLRLLTKLPSLQTILPYAVTMAAVGCIESLLTMQILDGIADDGTRGSTRRECCAQGLGNVASGLTGGIGGCALLGQSIINMQSGGGVSKLSGMSMAVLLGVGVVGAAPLLGAVPIAALVGVMLVVCQMTFSWSSLRLLHKVPRLDALTIALVSYVTVHDDLAKAVVLGTVLSAMGFAWKQSKNISAVAGTDKATGDKEYHLNGPLFFGSVMQFASLFDVKSDPATVIVDFTDSRVCDHSALEAINNLADRYGAVGKRVRLRHLSKDCNRLLEKAHSSTDSDSPSPLPPYEIIERDPATDPVYGLVVE